MTAFRRAWLVACCALCALVLGAGIASATRIELSNQTFRIVWQPMTITEGALFTECPLTLEGTFHERTFTKVSGSLLGFVTRAIMNEAACRGSATARVLAETLPWHVRYDSFEGTLPNITGLRYQIIGMAIQAVVCLYQSNAERPVKIIEHIAGGEIVNVMWEPLSRIPKIAGGVMCPNELAFQGNGIPTVLGAATRIRARLI
jgi:hypothetical protein